MSAEDLLEAQMLIYLKGLGLDGWAVADSAALIPPGCGVATEGALANTKKNLAKPTLSPLTCLM